MKHFLVLVILPAVMDGRQISLIQTLPALMFVASISMSLLTASMAGGRDSGDKLISQLTSLKDRCC